MERLTLLRKQHQLTQKKLADILYVSQQSIHKYEHDITTPNLDTLKSMASHFHTSVDYLLNLTDIPHKIEPVSETMLNVEELELVNTYRNISDSQKRIIQATIYEFLGKNGKVAE